MGMLRINVSITYTITDLPFLFHMHDLDYECGLFPFNVI